MPEAIAALLARYGYALLFLAVCLESVGVPVPGETALIAAALLVHAGHFSLPSVIAVAALAAIVGDNLGYLIGRAFGRRLVERYGRVVGLTPERLAAVDAFAGRHGARAVFFGRFVTGVRVFIAFFAGMTRMRWQRFLVWNAVGGAVWALVVGLAAYGFGESTRLLERLGGRPAVFLAALAVALSLVALLVRRHGRRLVASAEAWLAAAARPTGLPARALAFGLANLVAVALFVKIAEDVVGHESTDFDRTVALFLHRHASPLLDAVMWTFTVVGSAVPLLIVSVGVVALCLSRGDGRAALAFTAVAVTTEVLNAALKFGFGRPRPTLFAVETLHSYSFPSGHAMAAAGIYGMAAVVVARLVPRLGRPLAVLTPLLVLAIGLSRVYLGVHWPTDVLAGLAAGAFILVAGVYALGSTRP